MADFSCKVDEDFRSACEGLAEYRGTGYCVLHYPDEKDPTRFLEAISKKHKAGDFDFSGVYFPEDVRTGLPSVGVFEAHADFHGSTFKGNAGFNLQLFEKGADFHGATFEKDVTFWKFKGGATFEETLFKGPASFQYAGIEGGATFDNAIFKGPTSFRSTHLESATFNGAIFEDDADFERTTFEKGLSSNGPGSAVGVLFQGPTSFQEATFEGETTFRSATFEGGADFSDANFKGNTDFTWTTFTDMTQFLNANFEGATRFVDTRFPKEAFQSEPTALVLFHTARIDRPELFSFYRVWLRPSSLLEVSGLGKASFIEVTWYDDLKEEIRIAEEYYRLVGDSDVAESVVQASPYGLLAKVYRELSKNAEEDRNYPTANVFHYRSMDTLRLGSRSFLYETLLKEEVRQSIKGGEQREVRLTDLRPGALDVRNTWHYISGHRGFGLINTLYWALSGYGVRAARAFGVLVGIWAAFAVLYMFFGPPKLQDLGHAVVYSLGAVARLNPEPRPTEPGLFQLLVVVEGILGPFQIALLALAVRHKVMR